MSADAAPADEGETFGGYRRPDGRLGVRNRVLVLPSVVCSHAVAERIADRTPRAVAAPHDHGCGQLGADSDRTERALVGVATNPNVAGTVVVGLGCEKVQSGDVAAGVADRGLPVRELSIQGAGGTDACVDRGAGMAADLAAEASTREAAGLGDLTVGVVVDGVDDSTTRHVHPVLAGLLERVTRAGGRVVVAGNERFAAHPDETRARVDVSEDADTDAARGALDDLLDTPRPARARRVARGAASSFDAAAGFLGDAPVRDAVAYGDPARADGAVTLLDAPSRFEEAATGLAAAGAHVVVHATADGVPAGHPLVPVLKVSGDAETLAAVPDDVDVDAREADAGTLVARLRAVADGERTAAERHGLTEFAIARVGPSI